MKKNKKFEDFMEIIHPIELNENIDMEIIFTLVDAFFMTIKKNKKGGFKT